MMSINLNIKTAIILCFIFIFSSCVTPAVNRGNLGLMMRSLNNKSYGYEVIEDFTGNAPTSMIEKFEVRPGDCASNTGWSDCTNDRERSELSERYKSTGIGSEYWYGWNIYFPKDYVNIYPTKVALGQFHQERSHPVWMFQNSDGGYHLDDQVYGGTRRYYELLKDEELRGKWHKIEVHVRWSKEDASGFFKVWVNDVQKVDYKGQTMDAQITYFKYGLYRSFMSRYKNENGVNEVPAQTVYYSNVKRSKTRDRLKP